MREEGRETDLKYFCSELGGAEKWHMTSCFHTCRIEN